MRTDPYFYNLLMGLSDIMILLAGVTLLVFVTIYSHRYDWRSTVPGRSTAYFLWSLIAVLVLSGLGRFLGPDYFGREWLRFIVYGSVVFTAVRMLVALLGYWNNTSSDPSEPPLLADPRKNNETENHQ